MEFEEEILPEPFSEKNIDGSPISGSASGGSLFRSADTQQGSVPLDRRQGEIRQGERRAAYVSPSGGDRAPAPAPMPAPAPTSAPVMMSAPAPDRDYASKPVEQKNDYASVTDNAAVNDYGREESKKPVHMEPVKKEEPRFEPPVDEKPGMIPNPVKMPPVKVKSSVDYDYDYDSDVGNDTDYDYDYDSDVGKTAEITASIRSTEDMPPEEGYHAKTFTPDELPAVNTDGRDSDDDYGSADFGDDDDYGMDIDVDSDDDYR